MLGAQYRKIQAVYIKISAFQNSTCTKNYIACCDAYCKAHTQEVGAEDSGICSVLTAR